MSKHSYNFEDLTEQIFNRWTVIKQAVRCRKGNVLWICKCSCGSIRNVDASSLKLGASRSCGCLRSEISKKNGKKRKTHGIEEHNGVKFVNASVLNENYEVSFKPIVIEL